MSVQVTDRQELPGTDLLCLARASIEHGLAHGEPAPIRAEQLSPPLSQPAATFTTLRLQGKLRGCCGRLEAVHPLAMDVSQSAFRAAFRDTRFSPVGEHEIHAIQLEVSVLSALESLAVNDEVDLLNQLVQGRDGLVKFKYKGVRMAVISDVSHDRMRIISPIIQYACQNTKCLIYSRVCKNVFHLFLERE